MLGPAEVPAPAARKIRKLNGFRDLHDHREACQDEAVGVGKARLIDGGAPADDQFRHAVGAGEVEGGRDRPREAMGGGKGPELRVPGENDGGSVAEPTLHLRIGAPSHEEPAPGRAGTEVGPVARVIPGNASRGFPDDPVSRQCGHERDEHDGEG